MKRFLLPLLFFSLISIGCGESADSTNNKSVTKPQNRSTDTMNYEKATFAAGCFWCMESPFEKLDGVSAVVSGYIGGHVDNPTYEQVSSGTTGHTEAVQVTYDPKVIDYQGLLDVFWRQFDPTDGGGSFHDRGSQYRSGIFTHNDEQKKLAEASKQALDTSGKFDQPVATEITEATTFYKAEMYHQDYYKKNPIRYNYYRSGSGRDKYIDETWGNEKQSSSGNPSDEELKAKLTPLQYQVTRENGTEAPFKNEYWENHREGIYVDIISGEPLFSSEDKFESGTGWPSFTKPLVNENVVNKEDNSLFSRRVEVRSKKGDSHLGHVFPDGPKPTGQRYCINSASLRFIPKEDLKKEGYEQYLSLFSE